MPTREIPSQEWKTFFEGFSTYHKGWTVTIEVFSQEIGAQEETSEASFVGLVVEQKAGRDANIEVMLGATADNHITHTIAEPTHVRLESEGETEVLQIEAANQDVFLLSFHQAAPLVKTNHGAMEKTV
jgi:hypothetical protein